jgi:hypothetical protein
LDVEVLLGEDNCSTPQHEMATIFKSSLLKPFSSTASSQALVGFNTHKTWHKPKAQPWTIEPMLRSQGQKATGNTVPGGNSWHISSLGFSTHPWLRGQLCDQKLSLTITQLGF